MSCRSYVVFVPPGFNLRSICALVELGQGGGAAKAISKDSRPSTIHLNSTTTIMDVRKPPKSSPQAIDHHKQHNNH